MPREDRERDHAFGSEVEEMQYRDTSLIVPLGPYMHSMPMPRALWWSRGGVLFYEKGTPVAGASCFVLGVSMFVLHLTVPPRYCAH